MHAVSTFRHEARWPSQGRDRAGVRRQSRPSSTFLASTYQHIRSSFPLIKRSPTHPRRPTARPESTGRVSKIHPDQDTRFTMARNATGQGSEIRHRLDPQTSTAPSQSASRSSPALGGRRGVVRLKDKGKKRAFGWGLGQDGWVEEKFRRFGEHCARNQVGRDYFDNEL